MFSYKSAYLCLLLAIVFNVAAILITYPHEFPWRASRDKAEMQYTFYLVITGHNLTLPPMPDLKKYAVISIMALSNVCFGLSLIIFTLVHTQKIFRSTSK